MKQLLLFEPRADNQSPKPTEAVRVWKLYIDGAARNNPGPAGGGVVLYLNGKKMEEHGYYLGSRTNNQAEYFALVIGLFVLKSHLHAQDVLTIISDSQLLVRQFKGEYKIKHPELRPLHAMAQHLLQNTHHTFMHVMREENTEADAMANHGIDKKRALPKALITLLAHHGIT